MLKAITTGLSLEQVMREGAQAVSFDIVLEVTDFQLPYFVGQPRYDAGGDHWL